MSGQARPMSEDELVTGLGDALTLAGWRWTHLRRSDRALIMGMIGFPDLIALPPTHGGLLVIEAKGPTGYLTPDQITWLTGFALAGAAVGVIKPVSYDKALRLILAGTWHRDDWAWAWNPR